jgi:hypothetical protein
MKTTYEMPFSYCLILPEPYTFHTYPRGLSCCVVALITLPDVHRERFRLAILERVRLQISQPRPEGTYTPYVLSSVLALLRT